jgi:hypothetical protein
MCVCKSKIENHSNVCDQNLSKFRPLQPKSDLLKSMTPLILSYTGFLKCVKSDGDSRLSILGGVGEGRVKRSCGWQTPPKTYHLKMVFFFMVFFGFIRRDKTRSEGNI